MANTLPHEIDIQVTDILMKMSGLSFGEDEVRSLYTHVRQHAPRDSYTLDVGDFFAHPVKTKGKIREKFRPTVRAIRECERLVASGQSTAGREPKIEAIPYWVIMQDLNAVLKKLNQLPLEGAAFHAAGLVLMSALQGGSISFPDDEKVTLHLASFPGNSVELFAHRPVSVPVPSGVVGVMFPIIGAPDIFNIPEFLLRPDDPGRSVLRVSFEGGKAKYRQEHPAIRGEFVPGGVVHGGHRTVALNIPMSQPLAIRPPEKPQGPTGQTPG
ncbi:MAG TPA: hypothetical protein VGR92_03560 [Steroidobacteraceae bacterium]|nr:hypothetical protein [Steroidobacteraceae bacterium]